MTKTLDTRLGAKERSMLSGLIGRTFSKYRSDTFTFSNTVYGTLGIIVDNDVFELTNYMKVENDYFGYSEDVSRFKLKPAKLGELKSGVVDGVQVDHMINDTITDIKLVNDREVMTKAGELFFDYRYTRAIVFCFEGHELAFERGDDIFELIHIVKGYDALSKIGPADEFLSPMEGSEETAEREVLSLSAERQSV